MATKVESYKSDSGRLFLTEEAAVRHDAMERIIEAVPELALIRLRIEGNLDAIAQATAPLVSLKAKNHPETQPKTTLRPSDKPRWNACQPLQEVEFTTVRARCTAVQMSDSMVCENCNLTWDVNDPFPPACKPVAVDHGELAGTCDCSAGMSGASDHARSCPSHRVAA